MGGNQAAQKRLQEGLEVCVPSRLLTVALAVSIRRLER